MPKAKEQNEITPHTNEFLEHVIAVAPGHIYWKNLKGELLGCNNLQAIDAGLKCREDIVGLTDYDMPWKEDADFIRKVDTQVIKTGKAVVVEEKSKTHDGRNAIWLSTKEPLQNKAGKIIGIIGVSLDITVQKEAEQLKHKNIKLKAANKLNQILLENEAVKAEAERLKLESEVHKLKNDAYLIEKQSQKRVTKFINKMLHEIQIFRVEELNEKIGARCQLSDVDRQIKLTKREQQILYFLSLNKSPKDIAQIITIIESKSVSDSTISAVINKKLYPKFEVFNIGQLIEKAIILNLIPFLLDN